MCTRRIFLEFGIAAALTGLFPVNSFSSLTKFSLPERSLSFYNIHTDERLRAVYWHKGLYVSETLDEINYIMRDFRTEEVHPINPQLLDLLYEIHNRLETRQSFHIVSGYRSPKTNNYLYRRSKGVSKNSLHMYGMAVDVRVPRCDLKNLYTIVKSLKKGGVGYYPESDFVHTDVGEIRWW
jgi:uncharacterized protein YcbK (DUF882 family)